MGDAIPKIIKSTFQLKRGNSADWTSQNIVLAEGEPGFELDTGKLKIGDGTTAWNQLNYVSSENGGNNTQIVNKIFSTTIEEDRWGYENDIIIPGEGTSIAGDDIESELYNALTPGREYYFNSLEMPFTCVDLSREKIAELVGENEEDLPSDVFIRTLGYNFDINTFKREVEGEHYYIIVLQGRKSDTEIIIQFFTDLTPSNAPKIWSILEINPSIVYFENTQYDESTLIEKDGNTVKLTIGDSYTQSTDNIILSHQFSPTITDNQTVNYYKASYTNTSFNYNELYIDYTDTQRLYPSNYTTTNIIESYVDVTYESNDASAEAEAQKISTDENTTLYSIQGLSETTYELSNNSIWHIQNVNNKTLEMQVDTNLPEVEDYMYYLFFEGRLNKETVEAAIAAGESDPNYNQAVQAKQIIDIYLSAPSFCNLKNHDKIATRIFAVIVNPNATADENAEIIHWEDEKIDPNEPAGFFLVIPDFENESGKGTRMVGAFDVNFPSSTQAGLISTTTTINYLYSSNITNDNIPSWLGQTIFPKSDDKNGFIIEYNNTNSDINIISDIDFPNEYLIIVFRTYSTNYKTLPDTAFKTEGPIEIHNGTIKLNFNITDISDDIYEGNSNIPTASAIAQKIANLDVDIDTVTSATDIVTGSTSIPTAGAVADALVNAGKVQTVNNIVPDANGNIDINFDGAYYFGYQQDPTSSQTIFNNSTTTSVYINSPTQGYKTATKGAILYQRVNASAHGTVYYKYNSYIFDGSAWRQISYGYYPANMYASETSISASSTHQQFPTAKAVYDYVSTSSVNINCDEVIIDTINNIDNSNSTNPVTTKAVYDYIQYFIDEVIGGEY